MERLMRLAIIIPAYNEEKTITQVIKRIPKKIKGVSVINIIVIDDGSKDETVKVAKNTGATVLSHLINQGVGAATITGLEAAKKINTDIAITLDADGQHDPKEIAKIVDLIRKKQYDVVIGTRIMSRKKMPLLKIVGNYIMNWLTYVLYEIWVKDSQSGFKGFSKKAILKMKLSSSGYEICSEIIGEIKRLNLKYYEMPVKTIYTAYSKKRGQFSLNGVNIVIKLITRSIIK
jgi:glycosyltransferase involved in cell wall biosynthesis